jgi:hypothetical protein
MVRDTSGGRSYLLHKTIGASSEVLLGEPVLDFKDYQKRAADCLRLAQEVSDPTNKAMLLEMAQTWVRLAEQELAKSNADQK